MLERPNLSDDKLIDALAQHYGVRATSLTFLPIGNDATAWAFRVDTDVGRNYFLKLKRGPIYAPALTVPRLLVEQGITAVVAPLPSLTHRLWMPVSNFALTLYPFVEGRTGMDLALSEPQWTSLGAIVRQLHGFGPQSAGLGDVRREAFVPAWLAQVQSIQQRINAEDFAEDFADPLALAFASFWRDRQDEIQHICTRAAELGRLTAAHNLPLVLCHSDIHTANVLVDPEGRLHIVDWDQPLFAPKERDLMFFVEVNQGRPITNPNFFDGYANPHLDWTALAYYRYEWVVQEIGDDGLRVLDGNGGDVTRADALRSFRQLFEAGDVVDFAYQVDSWIQ